MLIHPMVERLRGLGLIAMADAFTEMQRNSAADDLSREDWLDLLVDREATAREYKLGRRLTHARLRQNAVIEDADLRTPRGLDRGLFQKLATCGWIRENQHLLIGGPTGVGKSWLACALGHKACRDGFSVLYRRAPRLFADLATARGEGRLTRLMMMLERTRLLIIDGWGPEPLNAEQRRDLLEIIDDRDHKGSLLMTSQIPVGRWHEIVGDPTLGDAILDRVIHRAHRIELKGGKPARAQRDRDHRKLDEHQGEARSVQPSMAATRRHTKPSAVHSSGTVNSMVLVTVTGDHDRPDWLITINGIRTLAPTAMPRTPRRPSGVDANRDGDGDRDDPPGLPHFDVGGIEPQIGPVALDRTGEERLHALVDLGAQPRYLALADAAASHRLHQRIDRARRDTVDIGLLDDCRQRLLGGTPRFQESREVAAAAQLGGCAARPCRRGFPSLGRGSRCGD